jgi:hypothetical protein
MMVTKLTLDGKHHSSTREWMVPTLWCNYGFLFPLLHKVDGDSIRGFCPLSKVYLLCCHGNIVGLKGDFIRGGVG